MKVLIKRPTTYRQTSPRADAKPWEQDAKRIEDTRTSVPARAATVESDVSVPARQALYSGILLGGGLALLAIVFEWDVPPQKLGLGAGIIAALVVWGWRLLASDRLLWGVERVTGWDINKDRVVGRPEPILVNARRAAKERAAAAPPPTNPLHDFVRACEMRGTAGRHHPNLSRGNEYELWRDRLIQAGWADWKDEHNHNLGWALTAPADEIIENIE